MESPLQQFHRNRRGFAATNAQRGDSALAARPFQREVSEINASLTYAMMSGLELSVWGRNLTNEAWVTTIFPGVAQAGTLSGYRNQPRTFGGLVRYRF
jgi:outer membrane receptor protein involved in Fe transport